MGIIINRVQYEMLFHDMPISKVSDVWFGHWAEDGLSWTYNGITRFTPYDAYIILDTDTKEVIEIKW